MKAKRRKKIPIPITYHAKFCVAESETFYLGNNLFVNRYSFYKTQHLPIGIATPI